MSKEKELEIKLEDFENAINESNESCIENDKNQIENMEYSYLIESSSRMESDQIDLEEELQLVLDKSTISKDQLIEYAINNNFFEMEYESLGSPFHYGGSKENEFYTLPWGGDRENQIDRSNLEEFKPSFNLKEEFSTKNEFEIFVKENIGNMDYLDAYWDLFAGGESTIRVIYNTDYDVVRCILNNEESLMGYLKENKKKVKRKVLKITEAQYHDLNNNYDGFCTSCGKINEGSHEPDAQNYLCSNCGEKTSFGIEWCMIAGYLEIVDSENESTLEDSY
mgnify:CR=1 FL=1